MEDALMNKTIESFARPGKIAVVGVSDKKFGGTIYKTLKQRGYAVFPVHPERTSFDNDKCYKSLGDLPADVKAAIVAVSPKAAMAVVDDAAAAGLTHLWFQQGKDFSGAVTVAKEKGIHTVEKKCILMYAEPVTGIHAVHRFFVRLFGKL